MRTISNYGDVLPRKSVTLSVTALDALMRELSLSSYFIFISKNPVGNNRETTVVRMNCLIMGDKSLHL